MPQLNPSPWLFIFLLSWITLLFIFKTKTLVTTFPLSPTQAPLANQQTSSWNWPWT